MSQNHGARPIRQSTSDKPIRLGLDRPSLFTDIDTQGGTRDGDTQRVRILSTLESSRQPKRNKSPMKVQGFTTKKRRDWQTAALIALMGMGILTLLASFVMVIMDGRHNPAKPEQAATPVAPARKGDAGNPLAALIVPTPHTSAVPHPAAVIENVASAGPVEAVPLAQQASASQAVPKVAVVSNNQLHEPAITADTSISASTSPTSSSMPVKRSPAAKTKDDDVALLEAMFAHTRPRQPPPSAGEEIKQRCGGLSGADAATCRARVCVQNPTATVCHQD